MAEKEITLAKALRFKNRLAGRIAERKALLLTPGVRRAGRGVSSRITEREAVGVDKSVQEAWISLGRLSELMIGLRTAISQANQPIVPELIELEETKSSLSLVKSLIEETDWSEKRAETQFNPGGGGHQQVVVNYVHAISRPDLETEREMYEKNLEKIQDKIEAHNATTMIKVPEDLLVSLGLD